jgi:uncharacterized protein YdcH (DUF465 family)
MDESQLKELMIARNEEFKRLYEEHKRHEEKLKSFEAKSFLSETEKLEEKELKKRKLTLKDRMYHMMAEYRKSL